MKMDRQELTFGKFDWDDKIPNELRPLWESHFQMMKDFGNLKFKRATIPDNAINLDIQTLDFGEQANQWYVRVYMPDFRGNMDLFRVSWFYPGVVPRAEQRRSCPTFIQESSQGSI